MQVVHVQRLTRHEFIMHVESGCINETIMCNQPDSHHTSKECACEIIQLFLLGKACVDASI